MNIDYLYYGRKLEVKNSPNPYDNNLVLNIPSEMTELERFQVSDLVYELTKWLDESRFKDPEIFINVDVAGTLSLYDVVQTLVVNADNTISIWPIMTAKNNHVTLYTFTLSAEKLVKMHEMGLLQDSSCYSPPHFYTLSPKGRDVLKRLKDGHLIVTSNDVEKSV